MALLSQGLQATLFERLQALHGEAVSSLLTVQYRMHAAIMTWASQALYEGRLSAHSSVAGHTLADLLVCLCLLIRVAAAYCSPAHAPFSAVHAWHMLCAICEACLAARQPTSGRCLGRPDALT